MPLKLDYEFLFVGRDDNSFLENYSCDFEQEHGQKSGQIFANIEIKNNPLDAEDIAVSIYDTMQKTFFDNMDLVPYERFEFTLKAINAKLLEFSSMKEDSYIGDLNVVIGARVGNELLISQCGEAEAYLIRKRYVSLISEGLNEGKDGGECFVNIASGTVEASDFVLFTNTRILRYISKSDLAACIRRGGVADTLMEIRDVLSTEMMGRLSMIGLSLSEMVADTSFTEKEEVFYENVDNSETVEMDERILKNGEEDVYMHEERTISEPSRKDRLLKGKSKIMGLLSNGVSFFTKAGSSKNKILIVLVSIILILVVSIFAANGMSDKQKKLDNLELILESVQTKITEAETKGTYDKEGAAFILDKAYTEALSVLNSGYYRDKANLYLVQINETRDKLDQVIRVSDENLYLDLIKNDPTINALGFIEVGGKKYFYTENKLYEINLDTISEGITLDSAEVMVAATGYDDRNSIVFLTKSGKLLEYREGTVSFMNTEDTTFRKAVAIDDWSNRIYLMDAEEGQIWKYTFKGSKDKFGVAEQYFTNALEEMKGAKDFIIDSYVYVIDSSSKIIRFYGGEKSDVTIVNAPYNGFKTADQIYTTEKSTKLFVIDDKANRVFVFDKENEKNKLNYQTQYMFEKETAIRGVYNDNDSGKVYILTDKAVFEL